MKYIRSRIRDVIPKRFQVPAKYWYGRLKNSLEPEMGLLSRLVQQGDHVIDVGGNRGVYAYQLWRIGCNVEVFEPNPTCCEVLEAWCSNKQHIHLHAVALSSKTGQARLHIPVDTNGIEHDASASLEHGFRSSRDEVIITRTLDSFEFKDVALIKIDVEGHEQSVLAGASHTINASHPALLIEIEQRHNRLPIHDIFTGIEVQGYYGFFLDSGRLRSLRDFLLQRDQSETNFGLPDARYITNFLFLQKSRVTAGIYRELGITGS
jgi:FkbM family methyltransferase